MLCLFLVWSSSLGSSSISNYVSSNYLILGDFNQVERFEDKIGGSSLIHGWMEFMDWRFKSLLYGVPFFGPRFTWSNNQLGSNLILERLNRAYTSSSWDSLFLDHILLHELIVCFDHAAIVYFTFNLQNLGRDHIK